MGKKQVKLCLNWRMKNAQVLLLKTEVILSFLPFLLESSL